MRLHFLVAVALTASTVVSLLVPAASASGVIAVMTPSTSQEATQLAELPTSGTLNLELIRYRFRWCSVVSAGSKLPRLPILAMAVSVGASTVVEFSSDQYLNNGQYTNMFAVASAGHPS